MRELAVLAVLGLVLAGCEPRLPIKFYFCGTGASQNDCELYAAFQDMEDCEFLRESMSLLCNRTVEPMVCTRPTTPSELWRGECRR